MRQYEALRRHCIDELERRGELQRLRAHAVDLLERGSLTVFCALRLDQLERRRRAARGVQALAALVSCAAVLALLLPRLGLDTPPTLAELVPGPLSPWTRRLAGGGVALALLGHVSAARTARRRDLYERLERAIDPTGGLGRS